MQTDCGVRGESSEGSDGRSPLEIWAGVQGLDRPVWFLGLKRIGPDPSCCCYEICLSF